MDDSPQRAVQGLGSFPWYVGGTQVLGLACVVITGVWMGRYHGGYAWDGSGQEFNVHPLCMVLGLVFLYGDAILVYRVFRNESKRNVKVLHAVLHLLALIISIVGIVAVFDFHNHNKIPNMYSLHSWCGMLTFVLFCVQWLMGLGFFLFPGTLMALRSWYLPLHVFFGLAMLAMSLATCLLGISEKLFFSIQLSQSATTGRPMGRRTIGPESSGLGEGLAGRDVPVPSCTSDSCGRPCAVHTDARCAVFPLTHWCGWLPRGKWPLCQEAVRLGLCFGGHTALDLRLSRVRKVVAAMRRPIGYHENGVKKSHLVRDVPDVQGSGRFVTLDDVEVLLLCPALPC
ncbi:transmembrane ascorbate-dependent reductase CYB561 isoform X1 [Oncorhynchus nerka]|uniref:transmembrane ascorbate-dependent reductase CYB561 isoform X1 n=1 Tax=Oncorhynchus nerka TaxID=8023 RepID=UPI0031B80BB2